MRRPNDPMNIDLTDAECIANVTSRHDGRPRWTVLSVYRLADQYIAQVEAKSTVEGERTKTRRVARVSLDHALRFFDDSDLARGVCAMAHDWAEQNHPANKAWTDEQALAAIYGAEPSGRKGFSGLVAADFGVSESTVRTAIAGGKPIKVPLAAVMPFLNIGELAAARARRNAK